MTSLTKTLTILGTAAIVAAAGAEPLHTIGDNANAQSLTPPTHFADGKVNHQLNPDDPFVFTPYSEFPKDAVPVIVAGDPFGTPPDSVANRLDPNVISSQYAGTAQLLVAGSGLCSATPVANRYVVSAGHCVDFDSNGTNDIGNNIRITFNVSGNNSTVIFPSGIVAVTVHPDYTGFGNPNVNDDLIVIELANDLPADIPLYPIYRGSLSSAHQVHLVGYGTTGDAINGYLPGSASVNTKRSGRNNTDRGFFADDEFSGSTELFQYDFDNWQFGGLGNKIETTVGGGDSGGPAYIDVNGQLQLYGVNTYTSGAAPSFGSQGGGILINGYLDFLDSVIVTVPGAFNLLSPVCGAMDQTTTTTLNWDDSGRADTYEVTIATDAGLSNVIHSQIGLIDSEYSIPGGVLDPCDSYFWSVSAVNDEGAVVANNAVCAFDTGLTGDINLDGIVDTADLGGLIGAFGSPGPFGDINGDGIVDTADLGALIGNFLQTCN